MTRISIAAVAALALAVPAASAAPAREAANPSIAAVATKTPQLSTLLSLVKKAGLAETLSKPGAYTVFAPTNAAFAKVPKATLEHAREEPRRAQARAALPRRRGQGAGGEGRDPAFGQDARRPDGEDPSRRQDRPDQHREGRRKPT